MAMVGVVLALFTPHAVSGALPQTTKPTNDAAVVERDPVFPVSGTLTFEGKLVRGSIRKSELDALLARRVALAGAPSEAEYGLDFSLAEGHFPVFSCQEWVQVRAQGLSSDLNTLERDMESSFVETCSVLFALRGATPAKESFIAKPRVGVSSLNLLPPSVLGFSWEEREAEVDKLTARGVKVSDLVASRRVKVLSKTDISVALAFDFVETRLTELSRADFDGDGVEDIFAAVANYAIGGTMRYFDYLILTRRRPAAPFTLIKPDWPALAKDASALLAGIDLKSSQVTKLKITRQEYKDDWPFDVDEGELACVNAGAVAAFFMANGKTYALNAWARQSRVDGQPVLTNTYLEFAMPPGAMFEKVFAMCQTK
jgi:hypothetical protein